ncbi:hypothetical protein ABT301_36420, partial [Streptomyces sp. NPDC000987]|uniref:hypothetical protein n=1 Tax=Streptomyces sp. NPDC000987 TaxID=3154374 RepID=UPI00331C1E4E
MCDILPWRRFGGAMRCDIVARALAALGEVDLLVLSNGAYPVPDGTVFSRVQVLPQHTPAAPSGAAGPAPAAPRGPGRPGRRPAGGAPGGRAPPP